MKHMPRAKGLAQIAASLGVRRDTARDILRRKAIRSRKNGDIHVVGAKEIQRYRHDREAIPTWENEGGAMFPDKRKSDHDDHL